MKPDPCIRHRRSLRLHGVDYSQAGAYFVTACTQNGECLFGEIVDGKMQLNDAGRMVQMAWDELPNHYSCVALDMFVVMPNHIHGILVIEVRAGLKPAPTQHGLPEIVRALKTYSSRRINAWRQTPGAKLWQRNYYEHIIRDDADLNRIREYIHNNPLQWKLDNLHPLHDPPDTPWEMLP